MKYLDIYKCLDRSNCRECGLPSCTAFVHAVINGDKKIGACTHLDKETVSELEKKIIVRDVEKAYSAAPPRATAFEKYLRRIAQSSATFTSEAQTETAVSRIADRPKQTNSGAVRYATIAWPPP